MEGNSFMRTTKTPPEHPKRQPPKKKKKKPGCRWEKGGRGWGGGVGCQVPGGENLKREVRDAYLQFRVFVHQPRRGGPSRHNFQAKGVGWLLVVTTG